MSKSAVAVLFASLHVGSLVAQTNQAVFAQRVRPILEQNCTGCHAGSSSSGGLSMDSLDLLLLGGKHGAAIVPGDSKASLLLQYVRGQRSPKMPMGGALDAARIDALAKAVDEMTSAITSAAKPNSHLDWLLHKPSAPPIPAVQDASWVKNPVDAFILSKLESKGLKPAPPASKRALLRRVYFDLIGMPPTPAEMDAFQSDAAPDAYEKIVDKLLADPRPGERRGRHWLDLARFAESDGFAIDGERPTAWRYRDYVIRSFNQDKHYDTFVKEQIAGDEMGGNRSERLVALGFLRRGAYEADANFKTQLRQDVLNELTGTVGQVFLGFTVGCARCHDHKYDPIPQRDFYWLQAFFAPMRVEDRAAPFTDLEHPKLMRANQRKFEDQSDEANDGLKKIESRLKDRFETVRKAKPDLAKGGDFMKALKDVKDPTFTPEERVS